MALASQAPIQMGRYRSCSASLRITTWRFESMCTRTLSTTITTRRPMGGLSHRAQCPARTTPRTERQPDDNSECEPADVGKERHAAFGGLGAERGEAADQL